MQAYLYFSINVFVFLDAVSAFLKDNEKESNKRGTVELTEQEKELNSMMDNMCKELIETSIIYCGARLKSVIL